MKQYRDTECQLLDIAHAAYAKLQKTAEARDPEVREINKGLRRVLGERQEQDEVKRAHEGKKASRSRSRSKKRSAK